MIRSSYARAVPSTPSRKLQTNTARVWTGYVAALAVYVLLVIIFPSDPVPLEITALGTLLTGLCFLPLALWYKRGKQGLPAFELICLSYAVQYSGPLFLAPNQILIHSLPVRFSWDETQQALVQASFGLAAMLIGYYAVWQSKLSQILPAIDLPLNPRYRSTYLVLGTVFGLLSNVVILGFASISNTFGALIGLGVDQLYIVMVLLGYLAYSSDPRAKRYEFALYSLIAVTTLFGLATGLLENAFVPLVIGVIVRWHSKGKLPLGILLAGVLIFAVLNSVKTDYRSDAWSGTSNSSISDRLTLWYDKSSEVVTSIASGDILQGLGNTISKSVPRLDLLHLLDLVNRFTPQYVPYYEGKTYSYFLVGWVPRVLWPDKPSPSEANVTVALDYNILEPFQIDTTSVGIGQIAEAYANYSLLGIIIVMALQGALLASIDRMLNRAKSDGGRAIYLALMVFFLNGIGTSTAGLFGALIQNIVANAVIVRVFSTGFRRPAKPGPPPEAE